MVINDEKVLKVLKAIKSDLDSAYNSSYMDSKNRHVKTATGRIEVLIELLKND